MILSMNAGVPQIFPPQKKSDAEKTTKFLKSCVDAGVELVNWELSSGFRKSKSEMVRLYNLVNGVVDEEDKKMITNPLNLQGYEFPGTAQTYPLITPLLSVLTGEERNRVHFFDVSVVNHDAISEKQAYLKQQIDSIVMQGIQDSSTSQEELEAKIKKFGMFAKFEYRDMRERMAHQTLTYLKKHLDLDFQFSRGFEDQLIVGEQIYVIDIVGGEPICRKGNGLNFTFVRSNDSVYPEDSDMIIEDGYLSLGKVIDEYYDVLKDGDIKKLESGSGLNNKLSNSMFSYQNTQPDFNLDDLIEQRGGIGTLLGAPSGMAMYGLSGAFDQYGRIRRTRVLWKSMRKIGFLTYVDENEETQKIVVPEQYVPNKERNEVVEWKWINEWWEGTRIADDIYVKMQPRPIQFREMINMAKCSPGIIGIVNNINSSKVTSFVSSIKPIQYLYDEFVYRLERNFMTSYGAIARLDVSQIPDGWDMDKWLYYATTFKWAIQDPFKEGNEGQARGKLAGTMNQPSNVFNLDQGNMIQQNIEMLNYLENRANDIAGITPQRKGSTSNRETMGGIERSVVQSSHRTEKHFSLHDHVKMRVYKALLETAKVAWREEKFKRSFLMDDMTQTVLDFDGQVFNEAEYGVMVNNAKEDTKLKNLLESSTNILLQNGVSFSTILGIMRTDNLSTMQRKIEQLEEEAAQRQQELEQGAIQQKEADSQRRFESEQADRDLKDRMNIRDNTTKVLLDKEPDNTSNDAKLSADMQKHMDKMALDEKKLAEAIRTNKANEQLKKESINKPRPASK